MVVRDRGNAERVELGATDKGSILMLSDSNGTNCTDRKRRWDRNIQQRRNAALVAILGQAVSRRKGTPQETSTEVPHIEPIIGEFAMV